MQVIALRPEVVVDDVEQHHQSARVRCVDQPLEVIRRAIARRRREWQHAVVSPSARPRKRRDGHQLDGRYAELDQIVEVLDDGGKRPCRREGPHVQFVHHGLIPRPAAPCVVAPLVRGRVDDDASPVHAIRIGTRGRIGNGNAIVDAIRIASAGAGAIDAALVPSVGARRHRKHRRVIRRAQNESDLRSTRRPQAKPGAAIAEIGAERHCVASLHVGDTFCSSTSARASME